MDNSNQNNASYFAWFKRIPPQPEEPKIKEDVKVEKKKEIQPNLPFYMTNGSLMPEPDTVPRSSKLFPEESPHNDRIIGEINNSQ